MMFARAVRVAIVNLHISAVLYEERVSRVRTKVILRGLIDVNMTKDKMIVVVGIDSVITERDCIHFAVSAWISVALHRERCARRHYPLTACCNRAAGLVNKKSMITEECICRHTQVICVLIVANKNKV